MRTLKSIATLLSLTGLGLILAGMISCRLYEPHWTPPHNQYGGYEKCETTGLERFIILASVGAVLFFVGVFLRRRKEAAASQPATMRRSGLILMFCSIFLHFFPFLPVGGLCFLAGAVLFLVGCLSRTKPALPVMHSEGPGDPLSQRE